MRIAVTQLATSSDPQETLANCISVISQTAACKPSLIVLPELGNISFLQEIVEQAKKHHCYITLSLIQPTKKHTTSCLLSPQGEIIYPAEQQALTTPWVKLGLLSNSQDTSFETSRGLTLQGAQLLCHSMNTFSLDQHNIHGPARACENKVFLASANKIGPFLTETQQTNEPLVSLGQSQIVAPNGQLLAKITHNETGFVFADIDLEDALEKQRPDETNIIEQRRPQLYQALQSQIKTATLTTDNNKVPATANVALFTTYKSNEQAIEDVCHYIENNLSDIIQLPELFFIADKSITHNTEQLAEIENLSTQLISQISAELRPFQYVCTSLVIGGIHQAVIINEQGLFATQQQLHFCQRYSWSALGNNLQIIELPLEQGNINIAMLTADDANIPEIVNLAALNNIHVLLVPFDIQEPCEVEYNLIAKAAEHRICIVAASREKSFAAATPIDKTDNNIFKKNKVKAQKCTGFIANLTTTPTQLEQWQFRKFEGYLNRPLVKYQHGKITKALVYPSAACNKLTILQTD
ncbi:nitrilase-related carbon-nitrogen hydrolase [Pseudocolwellia agarivorans]|uniref:nitrilase-related carbon-nitrogen hydrolase n=1 Tax=Pseudocolwellia agarivorans TaxID=1911682 RepID=UPI000984FF56|nr:nitrilase-related carbon-nitrogen hydrolase [Pseudocolwellia agarivorans]